MIFGMRWLGSSPWMSGGTTPSRDPSNIRGCIRNIAAVGVASAIVAGVGATGRTLLDSARVAPATETLVTVGTHLTTSDDWTEQLSDHSAWRGGRYSGGRDQRRPRRGEEAMPEWRDPDEHEPDEDELRERAHQNNRGTYRTVCVRLCDGAYFPISFSTTRGNFARDEAACQSRCRTAARLYVYPNPGGEPEQMVSVTGQPYTALNTAFLFRTKYDAACTCKPHPWEQEALARHRAYADAQRNRTTAKLTKAAPSQQTQAPRLANDGRRSETSERPMMLGAEARREATPPRNQRGGTYGRRTDWQSRAFSDD